MSEYVLTFWERLDPKYKYNRFVEKLNIKIAWILPREIVKWCFFRVLAHATTGKYSSTLVTTLTWQDAIDRWEVK